MTLFVVLAICSGAVGHETCRVEEAFRAPQGYAICSAIPGLVAHRVESDLGPRQDEFLRVRCTLR